jgi:hypothetical protein
LDGHTSFRRLFGAFLWQAVAVGMLGQSSAAQEQHSWTSISQTGSQLISVTATGSLRYRSEDILDAIGLRIGVPVTENDLTNADKYLKQCGAFDNVASTRHTSPAGIEFDLRLIDHQQFVPAFFDNIVWLSDEELLEQLHRRVPLFRGDLPLEGTLPMQVSEALQALLLERRVPHHVEFSRLDFELPATDLQQFIRESPSVVNVGNEGGLPVHTRVVTPAALQRDPLTVFNFHVAGPKIRIRNISVRGAKEPELTELRTVVRDLVALEYSRRSLHTFVEHVLKPVYLKHGYLKATFSDPQATVVKKPSDENLVDVTIDILPGKQYLWAGLQWSGATVFPIETLNQFIHLRSGHPANIIRFQLELMDIGELYIRRGYVASDIVAVPQIDDNNSMVRYQVRIKEATVYRVGRLQIEGLNSRRTAQVSEKLKLRSGDVYDQRYFDKESILRNWSFGWRVNIELTRNDEEKIVDIMLRFQK